MKSLAVDELESGDVFDCPIYTPTGELLTGPFTFLREEQLEQLENWGIAEIQADSDPLTEDELEAYRQKARAKRSSQQTTTADIFEVQDPVSDGVVEATEPLRETVKRRVQSTYERCLDETRSILKPLSQGRIDDAKSLYDIVQPIFDVAWNMQGALLYLLADLEGKDEEDYLFPYSLHTCLISVLLAKEMGYEQHETRRVGAAGLIHDVGMFKIPQHIRLATGDLSDEQYQMIESHPERGARILSGVNRLESSVKRVVAEHHEQVDGSGYPLGVDQEDLHPHSRIVNMAMTFVAMTQQRSHRSSLTTQETIKELVERDRDRYDDRVLGAFLKRFGLFPPGTFGRLETGQLVLSLEAERSDPKNPKVKVLTDPSNQKLDKPFEVSLANYNVSIVEVVHNPPIGGALELA